MNKSRQNTIRQKETLKHDIWLKHRATFFFFGWWKEQDAKYTRDTVF